MGKYLEFISLADSDIVRRRESFFLLWAMQESRVHLILF